jgi:hypothetical protein
MSIVIPKLHRQCEICKKVKKNSLFSKFGLTRGDYTNICVSCNFKQTDTRHLVLSRKTNIDDYILMYEFLSTLGYNGENIHEQFCHRWGLTPTERTESNDYSHNDIENYLD